MVQSKEDTSLKVWVVQDMKLEGEQVKIVICLSKMDQRGRSRVLTFCPSSNNDFCPVLAVTRYLTSRGVVKGYLFIHSDGVQLTKHQLWVVTSKALDSLGLKGVKFGTHSFCIGVASTASVMGYSSAQIQSLGHWLSAVYKKYDVLRSYVVSFSFRNEWLTESSYL